MNLTLHQFRKDLCQFRVILLVWFGFLFLDLAANLGWVGGVATSPQEGEGSVANFMAWLQMVCLWLLFLLIPSAVVLADSPGRREGFLRTRPLPGRDLFFAKAWFVLALILLPALVQEGIYLAASGLPAHYVLHGVAERFLYALPLLVVAAAFASLWRSYSQWAAGLAIAFGGTVLSLILLALTLELTGHSDANFGGSAAPTISRMLAALYASALAALVLALAHARFVWGPFRRWLGITGFILVYSLVAAYWPWNLFKVQPTDPASARAVVSQSPPKVPADNLQLSEMFGKKWDDRLDFSVHFMPEPNPGVFPNLVEWSARRVELVNASGQSFQPAHPPAPHYDQRYYGSPPATDLRIWAGILPKEVFFRLNQNGYPYEYISESLGEFKVDRHSPWLREPATLRAGLDGNVYRWEQVADLALNAPATLKDARGNWSFLGLRFDNVLHQNHLLLKRSQVGFSTATDARTAAFDNGPQDRYDFVIYNPSRKVALTTEKVYNRGFTTRAQSTALSQYWMDLVADDNGWQAWKSYTLAELAQCRLLIFEKTWLGTVPMDWQSPGFVVNDLLATTPQVAYRNQDGLSRDEVERRLAALSLPGPQASRAEACRYLVQAVPIMDASRYSQTPGEAVIARLATLVPEHLDVLLDGLPAMGRPANSAVIQAIVQGAQESQTNAIMAALTVDPGLIRVLFQRGWVAGAHDALYKLMDSPKPLSFEAIQAIASFQDPATYPRLLKELETSPRNDIYDILHTLPGMAESLAAGVDRMWRDHDRLMPNDLGDFRGVLSLALHTGHPEAFQYACRLLAETNPKPPAGANSWGLAEVFRNNVQLAGVIFQDQYNDQHVLDWMRHHPPDAFAFDPVRQRFGLRSDPTAGQRPTLNP